MMDVYRKRSQSRILLFSKRIMKRQAKTLKISANTTAVVAMYMSPGRVREYRMVRIRDAFCTVRVRRLMYFRLQNLPSGAR